MIDYYKVLGVSEEASKSEIKQAFRRLAHQHHPDKSDAPDASTRFIQIAEAYEILRDPVRRQAYDAARQDHSSSQSTSHESSDQQGTEFSRYAAESRAKAEEYSRMSWKELASAVLDEVAFHGGYAYQFGCGPLVFIVSGVATLIAIPVMLSDEAFDNPAFAVPVVLATCIGFIWYGLKRAKALGKQYEREKKARGS